MHELVELDAPLPQTRYSNPDLAPTAVTARSWNVWHIAALWVGMAVCIPTYMLAAGMIDAGMTWWQALAAILLGNTIVLVPMVISAHAGTRYGIPFPVFARAAFGLDGAHVPALLRSVVACGWFGIQVWIGGLAIDAMLGMLWSGWSTLGGDARFMGHSLSAFLGFGIFWLINLYFVWAGTESIKWLETLAAPFLIVIGLGLLAWAAGMAGGVGSLLAESNRLIRSEQVLSPARFLLTIFLPWVTAMVGFWATLALNIPDFTRYAKSQRDQMIGQALGLLTTMPLFAFIGVAVTSATVLIYGEAIWNPVDLIARVTAEQGGMMLGVLATGAIALATLSTNIAANVVAPANSFANLRPSRISFRTGGFIAAGIGILILPWELLDAYQTWLVSYSGLLGAIVGVLICDYALIRRGRLQLRDLYVAGGAYSYGGGVNWNAMVALGAGVGVALAGTLHAAIRFLFNGAWFSAAIVSFALYYLLMRRNTAVPVAASPSV